MTGESLFLGVNFYGDTGLTLLFTKNKILVTLISLRISNHISANSTNSVMHGLKFNFRKLQRGYRLTKTAKILVQITSQPANWESILLKTA